MAHRPCSPPSRSRPERSKPPTRSVGAARTSSTSWTTWWPTTRAGASRSILDNLNTHKKNNEWLARHPKVTFHYTPTRASWLNQVEGWFSILQGQSLTGASFTSVEQLKEHIDAFIERYNENAEPFVWTKSK